MPRTSIRGFALSGVRSCVLTFRLLCQKLLDLIQIPDRRVRPDLERGRCPTLGDPTPPCCRAYRNDSFLVLGACHLGDAANSLCHINPFIRGIDAPEMRGAISLGGIRLDAMGSIFPALPRYGCVGNCFNFSRMAGVQSSISTRSLIRCIGAYVLRIRDA